MSFDIGTELVFFAVIFGLPILLYQGMTNSSRDGSGGDTATVSSNRNQILIGILVVFFLFTNSGQTFTVNQDSLQPSSNAPIQTEQHHTGDF